jgi:CRISPR system Cascade subunit CasD
VRHLLYQVAAPIMSWGNENARSDRPTDDRPRKSAALGQLGAALGKVRADPWHQEAQAALGFASVTLRAGDRMLDYHTVLTPTGPTRYATRREEVEASDYTVQTNREYLSDAYFLIAFWQHPKGPGAELDAIAAALEAPTWHIYAGRKSCTLSLPLSPIVLDVPSLEKAFEGFKTRIYRPLAGKEGPRPVYWEDHPATGLERTSIAQRQDALVSREKHLFRIRYENEGSIIL